ncbi:MAG: response regulator [Oligoflexales bacterium]|nr:response regulator [Oligoflexales bacterium]
MGVKPIVFSDSIGAASLANDINQELKSNNVEEINENKPTIKREREWHLADVEVPAEENREIFADDMEDNGAEGNYILIVDDMVDMLKLIRDYLKNEGYRVSAALNGRIALEKCIKRKPDLLISDWMMPEMSGPELISQIRKTPHLESIPAILLTAKSDEISKKSGISLGADAYLGKPFDKLELLSVVRNLLRLKQGEKQIAKLNNEISENILRRFLPPELITRILQGEEVFSNTPQYQKITILTVSLTKLKDNFEELGPINLTRLLDNYYSEITSLIFSHKGVTDRLEDASIRAFWGAPSQLPAKIQTENARLCAIGMRKRLSTLFAEWNKDYGVNLNFRMGIHHGEAIVGTIGSSHRTDYTAIGTSVHIAKQIENYAKDGEILISMDIRDYLPPDTWVKHGHITLEESGKRIVVARLTTPEEEIKKAG